ncbi:MAG TPA: flagellar biosynthetic protein FliO [Bradyrhizobium sp.]|nr:flagellar biosynthetic protein FliO [Bradyrhizobium sp.]
MLVPFIFAFLAVLALIGVAAWLVRRFASSRLGASTNRGRMPRLAVIDAAAVDGRRRLVLVRRDNIEHLLMIGGPTDIVVESNIVRASQSREQLPQRTGLPPAATPEPSRIVPLPDTAWNEAEAARVEARDQHNEPPLMPEPPPRPIRPSFADELRRPVPQPIERRSSEPLTGFAPEPLGGRPEPRPELRPEPRLEPRAEPRPESRPEPRLEPAPPRLPSREPMMPRPTRPPVEMPKAPPLRPAERAAPAPVPPPPPPSPPAPTPAQNADQNLAEMAQRLEAALRRPAGAAPADTAPPVAPEPAARDRAAAPRSEPPVAPPPAPAASPKSSFENLEDEMASLLGRPKSSSS